MLCIDTVSIGHAVKAAYPGTMLDWQAYAKYLSQQYSCQNVHFFADETSVHFINYLKTFIDGSRYVLHTKQAIKKKISNDERIWYLSFAVDIIMVANNYGRNIFVSNDIELLPYIKSREVVLYGIGLPHQLREHCAEWHNIPKEFLIDN